MTQTLDGRRLVLVLYVLLVALTGAFGAIFGAFVAGEAAPRLFFLVQLPASPLGFAIFGIVTVGVGLGVPLALVATLSRHLDEADAEAEA